MKIDRNGLIKLISSMFIFGTIGIFRRHLDLPSTVIVLYRAVIGTVFLLLFFVLSKKKVRANSLKNNSILLTILGSFLAFNWIFLFEAYKFTSISIATMTYYLAPVFVTIFSSVLLKEKISRTDIISILLALFGMILLSEVYSQSFKFNIGIVYGLIAAVFYAGVVTINKFLKDIDSYNSTFGQLSIASLVMTIYIVYSKQSSYLLVNSLDLPLLILIGVVHTGISYLLYFDSALVLPSRVIALFSYVDPVVALLLAWVVLGETLSIVQIIGIAFILFALMYNDLKVQERKEDEVFWLCKAYRGLFVGQVL